MTYGDAPGLERRLIAVHNAGPDGDENAPPARQDGPHDDFATEHVHTDPWGVARLTEADRADGDDGDDYGREHLVDDFTIVADRHGWAVIRCGPRCGFTGTGPSELKITHQCGQPRPLARLVVGCFTAVVIVFMLLLVVEDIAGVK